MVSIAATDLREANLNYGASPNWNIGMLEYWNTGKMGFGILQYCVNGSMLHGDKILNG